MNYNRFLEVVTEELTAMMGEDHSVRLQHVVKNNSHGRDVICICSEGENVSPVIDLEPFFEEHRKGTPLADILSEIVDVYRKGRLQDFRVEELRQWESVRNRIGGRLISAEANRTLLGQVPHRRFLDLALIYDIRLESTEHLKGSAIVNSANMDLWEVEEADLYEQSLRNLPELLPARIHTMEDLMQEMLLGTEAADLLEEGLSDAKRKTGPEAMYVVTNSERHYGALAALYPDVLRRFLDGLGWESAYLIPSSVHEMLIIPVSGDRQESHILSMIREVNEDYVEASDILTDSLYVYHREREELSRVHCEADEPKVVFGVTIL